MLAEGQDQNAFYLLHYAVDDGLYDIAKLLIEKGKIPMDTLDQSGWGATHLAAGHNYVEMIKLLIEKGADINIRVRLIIIILIYTRPSNVYFRILKVTHH